MRVTKNWMRATFWKRRVRFWAFVWMYLLIFYIITSMIGVIRWRVPKIPANFYPSSSVFTQVRDSDTYLYSALVNMAPDGVNTSWTPGKTKPASRKADENEAGFDFIIKELEQDIEIILTGLDRSRIWPSSFACCVVPEREYQEHEQGGRKSGFERSSLLTSLARSYFEFVKPISWDKWLREYWAAFSPSVYMATQFSCRISRRLVETSGNKPVLITLAPMPSLLARTLSSLLLYSWPLRGYQSYCPSEATDYLPVVYPRRAPDDLALCAKVNHNGGGAGGKGPDPRVLAEWFELNRILGVDRVVVYDLGENSNDLNRVFQYYQTIGLLDLQPYDLPGEPRSRSLGEDFKHSAQFVQDETMVVLECKVRTSGYGLVLSYDKDEVLVPRRDVTLKDMLRTLFTLHPSAAALNFQTQFFITTWQPSNPEERLLTLRYQQTRKARWECWKYAFQPAKVKAAVTHEVFAQKGYNTEWIDSNEATLHHYRSCPKDTWGTCDVTSVPDHVMMRYKDKLSSRLRDAASLIRSQVLTDDKEGDDD